FEARGAAPPGRRPPRVGCAAPSKPRRPRLSASRPPMSPSLAPRERRSTQGARNLAEVVVARGGRVGVALVVTVPADQAVTAAGAKGAAQCGGNEEGDEDR